MAALLSWTKPRAVAELEWHRVCGAFKRAARCCMAAGLLLGVLAVYVVHQQSPGQAGQATGFVAVGLLLSLTLVSLLTLGRFVSYERYEVCLGGLYVGYPGRGKLFRWADMDDIRFGDHPEVPEIRCLEFSDRRSETHRRWCFDPWQVDEAELQGILEERLRASYWESPAE